MSVHMFKPIMTTVIAVSVLIFKQICENAKSFKRKNPLKRYLNKAFLEQKKLSVF